MSWRCSDSGILGCRVWGVTVWGWGFGLVGLSLGLGFRALGLGVEVLGLVSLEVYDCSGVVGRKISKNRSGFARPRLSGGASKLADCSDQHRTPLACDVGAMIIRIGVLGGILYYDSYNKEPPKIVLAII